MYLSQPLIALTLSCLFCSAVYAQGITKDFSKSTVSLSKSQSKPYESMPSKNVISDLIDSKAVAQLLNDKDKNNNLIFVVADKLQLDGSSLFLYSKKDSIPVDGPVWLVLISRQLIVEADATGPPSVVFGFFNKDQDYIEEYRVLFVTRDLVFGDKPDSGLMALTFFSGAEGKWGGGLIYKNLVSKRLVPNVHPDLLPGLEKAELLNSDRSVKKVLNMRIPPSSAGVIEVPGNSFLSTLLDGKLLVSRLGGIDQPKSDVSSNFPVVQIPQRVPAETTREVFLKSEKLYSKHFGERLQVAESFDVSTVVNQRKLVILESKDSDGRPLRCQVVKQPNNGTLNVLIGNRITYAPNKDFIGEDSFEYRATDAQDLSSDATVNITVVGATRHGKK